MLQWFDSRLVRSFPQGLRHLNRIDEVKLVIGQPSEVAYQKKPCRWSAATTNVPVVAEGFPDAKVVHRPSEINAWDHADFVAAVKKTCGKKLLVDRKVNPNESALRTLSIVFAEEDSEVILGVTA